MQVIGFIALQNYWEAGSIVFISSTAPWLESRLSFKDSATAKMNTPAAEEARTTRPETRRIIDSYSKYYSPVVFVAELLLVVLPLTSDVHRVQGWFHLAVVVVVSVCPCAIVLSSPAATCCALLSAAKSGILVNGGHVVETLGSVKLVVFNDRREFCVSNVQSACSDVSVESLLYWFSSVESKASHPVAAALVDFARKKSVEAKTERVCGFQMFPGEGVYGEIDGRSLYIGNQRIAARAGCAPQNLGMGDNSIGAKTVYVFCGGELIGSFSLSESCRNESAERAEVIEKLRRLQIETVVRTEDSTAAAMSAQKQMGNALGGIHAMLHPEDEARILNDLCDKEGCVVMVRDGTNNASAMIAADLSISMGISGQAIIASGDIRRIPDAICLGRKTRRKIVQNITLSVAIKVSILALSLSRHPLPWASTVSDMGICLLVILNSVPLLIAPPSRDNSTTECRFRVGDEDWKICSISPRRSWRMRLKSIIRSSGGKQTKVQEDHGGYESRVAPEDVV